MKIIEFFKTHPFINYAVLGLFLWAIVVIYGIQYDDSGIRGFIFWFGELFKLPFWIISELLFLINGGKVIEAHVILTIIGGLILCVVLDIIYRKTIKKFRRKIGQRN